MLGTYLELQKKIGNCSLLTIHFARFELPFLSTPKMQLLTTAQSSAEVICPGIHPTSLADFFSLVELSIPVPRKFCWLI